MVAELLESTGTLLAVLTPLVTVPLTVIIFYLRSLREQQVSWHGALARRVELLEESMADLRKTLTEFERDYTGKEEWLRECMHTRRVLEQLIETTVRVETGLHSLRPPGDARPYPTGMLRSAPPGARTRADESGALDEDGK